MNEYIDVNYFCGVRLFPQEYSTKIRAYRIMKFLLSFLFEFIHSSETFCKHQKSIFHISIEQIKEIRCIVISQYQVFDMIFYE